MFKLSANGYSKNKSWIISIISCLTLWIILSYLPVLSAYIPSPFKVLNSFWSNKSVLLSQFYSTFTSAIFGFLLGLSFAIITTLIVILREDTRRFFSMFAIIIYSVPLIAAAPLAALLFTANKAGIVLGCIGAYLPFFLLD